MGLIHWIYMPGCPMKAEPQCVYYPYCSWYVHDMPLLVYQSMSAIYRRPPYWTCVEMLKPVALWSLLHAEQAQGCAMIAQQRVCLVVQQAEFISIILS